MDDAHDANVFVGRWSYRSFLNETDLATPPNSLLFGRGTIHFVSAPATVLKGTIGGDTWSLDLQGARSYGNPMTVQFQGRGVVDGVEWVYAYVGYLVPHWPNGVDQRAAMVGSIVRVQPHPSGTGGVAPAGVVASWYAVKTDES